MRPPVLSRRLFLAGATAAGASVGFMGRASAAEPGRKLVFVIARGGMDGLSVAPPFGDPDYARLRGALALGRPGAEGGALDLDGYFGLHPALTELHALARAGQARIAPAVAIPERQRSHFEAQDLLESGGERAYAQPTGWLNRALPAIAPAKALSVGAQTPLVLRGPVQAGSWVPGRSRAHDDRVLSAMMDLYRDDAALGPALASALEVDAMADMATEGRALARNDVRGLGQTVARFMVAEDGPDVVALSLDGWDTHARQGAATGQLANRLGLLDALIAGLRTGLGAFWSDTVVIVATEFGRTARANGTGGTDHGTASTAILAGGALKRGGLIGDWPTLAESKLFESRDLAPTLDVRSLFKGVLRDHMGVDRAALERSVFPDSAEAPALSGLV